MTTPAVRRVMAVLNQDAGLEPQALFVGGCVRNTLLGRAIGDIDIATRLTPEMVMQKLESAGIKAVPTGLAHGTVTAVTEDRTFEITTLRRDVETDGRHAVIAFTDDWAEDAARRDFTMNTLLADETGNIYDPAGKGLEDLRAAKIRFVGEPAQRIAEDYLRILRFFRFHAFYGEGEPDKAALQACKDAAAHINDLSRERITQEFLKILSVRKAAQILGLMFDHNVMAAFPDEHYDPAVMENLCALQEQENAVDVMARLSLLVRTPEAASSMLILSNVRMKMLVQLFDIIESGDENNVKALVYRYGADITIQALLIRAALAGQEHVDLSIPRSWTPPEFPLGGDDVLAAGIEKGPEIGKMLAAVEQWWVARDFSPGREDCLVYMQGLIG
ncbi:MAG: CCA tRNA nucleotidyltransferase [Rhodospirillales bacterium]|nr:CCA tRNA nucleotidyltransferase [Rhodospirillales bacterium]